jgi:hypothetical protein
MSTPRGTQLAWPFALVGFVGGAFVGTIPHESWVVHLFALVTAFVAGCFGAMITRERRRKHPARAMGTGSVVVGTLVAGAANGAVIVSGLVLFHSPAAFPFAFIIGLVVGALFSLPFMPVLAHVAFADERVGLARPGTLLDRADRRGVWSVTLGWVGASMIFGAFSRWSSEHLHALLVVAAIVLAAMVAVLVADVRTWLAIRGTRTGIDPGVGSVDLVVHDPPDYRAPPSTSLVLRDPTQAREEIDRALKRDILALMFACAGTALLVLTRYVATTYRPL